MKRIVLWALSTVSALVLLFGYSTSTSGVQATKSPSSVYSSAATSGTGSSGGHGSGGSGSGGSGSGGSGSRGSGSAKAAATRKVDGSVAQTRWGPVQVQLEVSRKRITRVSLLQYPNGNGTDQQINSQALPILTQQTISAQSAQIDMVSGATVTSTGYIESLQSAIDQAGL